jgi:hypothetical protein
LKAYEVNHIMMNVAGVASYAWQWGKGTGSPITILWLLSWWCPRK